MTKHPYDLIDRSMERLRKFLQMDAPTCIVEREIDLLSRLFAESREDPQSYWGACQKKREDRHD